jgi:hypothetical protein
MCASARRGPAPGCEEPRHPHSLRCPFLMRRGSTAKPPSPDSPAPISGKDIRTVAKVGRDERALASLSRLGHTKTRKGIRTAPAIAAISLGLVGRRAMSVRTGRNYRFNAAGNALTAGLIGLAGQYFAKSAIFQCRRRSRDRGAKNPLARHSGASLNRPPMVE